MEPEAEDDVVVPGQVRPSRSAKRIVAAVAVAVVVLLALAGWVLVGSYQARTGEVSVDCDARIEWAPGPTARAARARFERSCDHQREQRRTTALLLGAGVAIAACAVSTVPSRRLTGDRLGPLR